jgi:elongator complex protein 3
MAQKRLKDAGGSCRCIRCREIGRNPADAEVRENTLTYRCCGGAEHFLSVTSGDALIGFVRLRYPGEVFRPELEDAALIRELHVYGGLVPLGKRGEGEARQHRSYGSRLLARAEEMAKESGYSKVSVMSGVGVRPYYNRHGYVRTGPYMIRNV